MTTDDVLREYGITGCINVGRNNHVCIIVPAMALELARLRLVREAAAYFVDEHDYEYEEGTDTFFEQLRRLVRAGTP